MSPFFLGLFVFTFILLMNKVLYLMDLVVNKGIPFGDVCFLVLYLLPSFLVLIIPVSVLLAILIALGKFSSDAEVIAMKASGISLMQMLPPFAAVCCIGFLLTGLLTLYLLPKGNRAFKYHLIELAQTYSAANLEQGVFNEPFEDMTIYAQAYDPQEQKIDGILIADKRDPNLHLLIAADKGIIISEPENMLLRFRLFDGSLHRYKIKGGSYEYGVFDTYEMKVSMRVMEEERSEVEYREMSLGALFRLARERKQRGDSAVRIGVEVHQRFAFPFACLVFGILGVPLGVYWRRGGRAYGFVLSIFIVFLYYLLLSTGENLAKSGLLFPWMGIWLPNVLLGALGIYVFRKVSRDQPMPLAWILSGYVEPFFEKILSRFMKKRADSH